MSRGEFLLYQTEDAQTLIQVRFQEGGLWLTQQQLADLFQSTPQNITQHIRAIYQTGELREEATCKPYLQVRQEIGRHAGKVSAEAALAEAQAAYARYQQQTRNLPSRVEKDFEDAIAKPVKRLEKGRKKALPGKNKGGAHGEEA